MTGGRQPASGGFDASYFPHLVAAEDRHFWFRARNAVIRAVVAALEPQLPAGYRVLEVGCGSGNTLRVLEAVCRRGFVVGLDSEREGLATARQRVSCGVIAADLRALPFDPSIAFDVVAMFDVLEHIPDDGAALAATRSRMRPGATLLITVPAAPELWGPFDEAAHHCRRYTIGTLSAVLQSCGFDVRYLSPFMASLYPLAWLKRRLLRSRRLGTASTDAVLDDLRVVPVVNACLAWLLAAEAGPIAARRRLPFGTSLLAIATCSFTR